MMPANCTASKTEPDRYYTPEPIARRVAAAVPAASVRTCVDAACGAGSLLAAAKTRFPGALCIGVDVDRAAILRLKRRQPEWAVGVADILSPSSRAHCSALKKAFHVDVVLANPPFSMTSAKGLRIMCGGAELRCSTAMAHLLANLEVFQPSMGIVGIVPESLLFSDLDARAREILRARMHVDAVESLHHASFLGARASSVLLRLRPLPAPRLILSESGEGLDENTMVVRGGLPLHEARFHSSGMPFLHTTNIRALSLGGRLDALPRVQPIGRGHVVGTVLLLPRVGLPWRPAIRAIDIAEPVQLSDCVLAIVATQSSAVYRCATTIHEKWRVFRALYRGTGAKYTTVERLAHFVTRYCS